MAQVAFYSASSYPIMQTEEQKYIQSLEEENALLTAATETLNQSLTRSNEEIQQLVQAVYQASLNTQLVVKDHTNIQENTNSSQIHNQILRETVTHLQAENAKLKQTIQDLWQLALSLDKKFDELLKKNDILEKQIDLCLQREQDNCQKQVEIEKQYRICYENLHIIQDKEKRNKQFEIKGGVASLSIALLTVVVAGAAAPAVVAGGAAYTALRVGNGIHNEYIQRKFNSLSKQYPTCTPQQIWNKVIH